MDFRRFRNSAIHTALFSVYPSVSSGEQNDDVCASHGSDYEENRVVGCKTGEIPHYGGRRSL